ncbi:F0F1 ATP synthase subunit A [Jatrophihabitans sp.]|uniref:F0F1 ATP synthase subunit A n=1 Tax=Jatrophihabitans sp. TaxID=1932789 RepID=UPI0030C742BD|nr:synthase subcomplex subunit [Jatrophihabitans sp.]
MSTRPVAIDINPGEHLHWIIGGVTFNSDTILGTLIAGGIIVILGILLARGGSATKPTKLQLAFEMIITEVRAQVKSTLGLETAPFVVPMAFTLFVFILLCNWFSLFPTGNHPEYVPPPTADVNLTYALALIVIVSMHFTGVRKNGIKYYAHLFRKPYVMIPLNFIEEIMKPITLALRLFGNIFSGTIMVALIAALPAFALWLPTLIWRPFDLFIGLIQAFIFGLLTVLYFGSVAPHETVASDKAGAAAH